MKHTKGEWIINYTGGFVWNQDDGSRIAEFENSTINDHIPDQSERRANAKLIAEAGNVTNETGYTPRQLAEQKAELLKVCQKAMESEIDGSYVAASEWWGKMKKAIKKATL